MGQSEVLLRTNWGTHWEQQQNPTLSTLTCYYHTSFLPQFNNDLTIFLLDIRVLHKVRKTRHQIPEFGPKPGEIPKEKKPAKKYISLQREVKLRNAPLFVPN
jgi:hypothetical protein